MDLPICDRPLGPGDPVVGREALIKQLAQGLSAGRSYCLCGGPKLGRSTTLLALRDHLRGELLGRPEAEKLVPAVLDVAAARARSWWHRQEVTGGRCEPFSASIGGRGQGANPSHVRHPASGEQSSHRRPLPAREAQSFRRRAPLGPEWFVRGLWRAVAEAVLDPQTHGRDPPPRIKELTYATDQDPWLVYERLARELWEDLRGTTGWCQLVLLIDNSDALITPAHQDICTVLARHAQANEPWAPCGVVMAGSRPLRQAMAAASVPLGFLRPVDLAVLRDGAAKALLSRLSVPPEDPMAEALCRASGKHPYVLQRLVLERLQLGESADLGAVVESARVDLEALFEAIFAQLGPQVRAFGEIGPEHALMGHLVAAGEDEDIARAEHVLKLGPLRDAADTLVYLGVAERVLQTDVPHLRAGVELWNEWYRLRVS